MTWQQRHHAASDEPEVIDDFFGGRNVGEFQRKMREQTCQGPVMGRASTGQAINPLRDRDGNRIRGAE
jgi:hypothetical protein